MKHSRFQLALGAALVLGLGAAFFHGSPARADETSPAVTMAPPWKLKDLDGNVVSSEQFKGKVVVIDFWATWCAPCVGEIPGYIELQKKYGAKGLAIIGVALDRGGLAHVKEFVAAKAMNYTVLMGDDKMVESFGGVEVLPTTLLINRDGKIINQKVGAASHEDYEKLVAQALQ